MLHTNGVKGSCLCGCTDDPALLLHNRQSIAERSSAVWLVGALTTGLCCCTAARAVHHSVWQAVAERSTYLQASCAMSLPAAAAGGGGATEVMVEQRAHRTFCAPAGYINSVRQPWHTICAEGGPAGQGKRGARRPVCWAAAPAAAEPPVGSQTPRSFRQVDMCELIPFYPGTQRARLT